MTKSQIIRELTIELAALQKQLELETELRQAQGNNKTLDKLVDNYTLRYENERAARERVLEHVKALETEIERMRVDVIASVDEWISSDTATLIETLKKALGVIK